MASTNSLRRLHKKGKSKYVCPGKEMNNIKYIFSTIADYIYCLFHRERENICFTCEQYKSYPVCESTKWRFYPKQDIVLKCNGYKKQENLCLSCRDKYLQSLGKCFNKSTAAVQGIGIVHCSGYKKINKGEEVYKQYAKKD